MIAAALFVAAGAVQAQEVNCRTQAEDRKLLGRELSDFLRQCRDMARIRCEAEAEKQQFEPGKKIDFVKKCFNKAVGA